MEAYWQGEEMISRYYWAKRRDTDDIIWVRVDVRIVPQLDTGDLFAFYNNWDVTHEKNREPYDAADQLSSTMIMWNTSVCRMVISRLWRRKKVPCVRAPEEQTTMRISVIILQESQ